MPYAKRDILPGFPKTEPFQSRSEVDRYFSDNRVACLLCGRAFRILETHLRKVHNKTGDEYRELFGIPYMRGLCGASFSDQRVSHGRRLFEDNEERQRRALASAIQEARGSHRRQRPEFLQKERIKYGPDVYAEFLRRVVSGRTQTSVAADSDMPTIQHVYWYAKRDATFAKAWRLRRHLQPQMMP